MRMAVGATTAGRITSREAAATRRDLAAQVTRRITVCQLIAHGVGIVDVFILLVYVLPAPTADMDLGQRQLANFIALGVYLPLSAIVGTWLGLRMSAVRTAWVREGREPDPEERAQVLRLPARCFKLDAGLWLGAAILFAAVNLPVSLELAGHVASTIVLGGITTCAIAQLATERELRPLTELALAYGPPSRPAWPGVEGRLVLAWLLATGSPLLGVIMVGIAGATSDVPADDIARAAAVLGAVAFAVGLGVTLIVARSVAAPLAAVRMALGRVQAGDLATEVAVDDGSEVGLLQSGFNSMASGLRDRERMQELFARHVGEDVARAALADEPRLGGEVQEVAVLFVDLVGSTTLAMQAPPERVVARLNRFFAIVVDVAAAHGGWVNKFEGDGALCVFGAPVEQEDMAGCALAAARDLDQRLRRELPEAQVGIGLSAGPAVAGWVGAQQRFEYTVIGDPVNVAARLCDLAKRRPERLLATRDIVRRAGEEERQRWSLGEAVELRGRPAPTTLAVPA